MKILVLSDSHGAESVLRNILRENRSCDMFIHLGDGGDDMTWMNEFTSGKQVCILRGNCDWAINQNPEKIITKVCGKTIFACHGHLYGVKNGLGTIHYAALEEKADICLYGHTHIQRLEDECDMIILNPGAVNKGEYAVIEILGDKINVSLF